jgi:DNA-binding NarL/FixJ family response regulator
MKTMVVCVPTLKAAEMIETGTNTIGPVLAVRTVDCAPALFVELGQRAVEVALVDFALAAPNPIRFTQVVRARFPRTGLVLCGATDNRTAAAVVAAGARGVLQAPSGKAKELLVGFAQAVMNAYTISAGIPDAVPRQRSVNASVGLSERELQVLWGMSEGMSNVQIGCNLHVSEDTVKTHAKNMYRKLEVRDRAHAVAKAFRLKLITLGERAAPASVARSVWGRWRETASSSSRTISGINARCMLGGY